MKSGRAARSTGAERSVFWLLLLTLTQVLIYSDWLWRWDQVFYDAQLRLWHRPPPQDLVIVAIDEASLQTLGRWPWSRELHARLIDRLTVAGARAIALDIIFAEPSAHRAADRMLTAALNRNGRTVLPVLVEQPHLGGQLIESLPVPSLIGAAAALGHVHVELDPDGIARSVYLRVGLGSPHWWHLVLSLLGVTGFPLDVPLPGERNPDPSAGSPYLWVRDHRMLIPFAGPPGHFRQVSYAQVLDGDYPADTFRNKLVLVGVTATGMGDALPTPVSGYGQAMAGVEINANILDALRRGISIEQLALPWRMLCSGLLVLAQAVLFTYLTPRGGLLATVVLLVLILAASLVLLHGAHLWFPPAAILVTLSLSYPLWSWRRLEFAMRYLDQELAELHGEQVARFPTQPTGFAQQLSFLRQVLPIEGVSVKHAEGVEHTASAGSSLPIALENGKWVTRGDTLWLNLGATGGMVQLRWRSSEPPTPAQASLINDLGRVHNRGEQPLPRGTLELVEARIEQVQQATAKLRKLRRFIADTVSQMADGVIVANTLGIIALANEHAALYLVHDADADLTGKSLLRTLEDLEPRGPADWPELLRDVLLEKEQVQVETQHRGGRDILVQLAPLTEPDREFGGLIINLSDITPFKDSERKRAEVLGFLSHDLRSPLVSLLALVEIGKARHGGPEFAGLLARMQGYTENTLVLAEQFLELARAESGENLVFQDSDLSAIAFNAAEQVWALADEKQIQLEQRFDPEEAWTRADPNLIERALVNLLNNAIKYSPSNGSVRLTLSEDESSYRCCVEDEGPGVSEADLPRLFDRFYRVQGRDQPRVRGIGLGLAFVKVVAERHGGKVSATSQEGKGSCFCLVVPKHAS